MKISKKTDFIIRQLTGFLVMSLIYTLVQYFGHDVRSTLVSDASSFWQVYVFDGVLFATLFMVLMYYVNKK